MTYHMCIQLRVYVQYTLLSYTLESVLHISFPQSLFLPVLSLNSHNTASCNL